MNVQELADMRDALAVVHDTIATLILPGCDRDDLFELMDRVEAELMAPHPNAQTLGTCLNSIARSLRNQPEAREICLQLQEVLESNGLPSHWQSGL